MGRIPCHTDSGQATMWSSLSMMTIETLKQPSHCNPSIKWLSSLHLRQDTFPVLSKAPPPVFLRFHRSPPQFSTQVTLRSRTKMLLVDVHTKGNKYGCRANGLTST